ncbi:MAG: hypothetical protein ACOYMM_07190 [Phycisphaerales bacterium]
MSGESSVQTQSEGASREAAGDVTQAGERPATEMSTATSTPTPLFRFDPGWPFVIAGLALIVSAVLIPAQRDLHELEQKRSIQQANETRAQEQLLAYQQFLADMDRKDPRLLERLVRAQLNKMPKGERPLLLMGSADDTVPQWIEASVDVPVPEMVPYPDTLLSRLATGPRRLWVLATGAFLVFMGVMFAPTTLTSRRPVRRPDGAPEGTTRGATQGATQGAPETQSSGDGVVAGALAAGGVAVAVAGAEVMAAGEDACVDADAEAVERDGVSLVSGEGSIVEIDPDASSDEAAREHASGDAAEIDAAVAEVELCDVELADESDDVDFEVEDSEAEDSEVTIEDVAIEDVEISDSAVPVTSESPFAMPVAEMIEVKPTGALDGASEAETASEAEAETLDSASGSVVTFVADDVQQRQYPAATESPDAVAFAAESSVPQEIALADDAEAQCAESIESASGSDHDDGLEVARAETQAFAGEIDAPVASDDEAAPEAAPDATAEATPRAECEIETFPSAISRALDGMSLFSGIDDSRWIDTRSRR